MSEEIALDAVGQRYQLNGEVGRGGMSVVYQAIDPRIGRKVAIKLLHPHLATREDARRRFLQEAKAIALLENPNILKIYDYDSPDGAASYIVSEFIEGVTLKAWAERSSIKHWEIAALLAVPLFRALAHAHDHGVIHRDVKPENMMIRARDGSPVLMDFGIAHMVDSETLTATGAVIGSPAHMAPEVVNGERLTPQADLFSMGTVLYWMVCGALPFVAPNPAALFRRILEARFDPIQSRRPEVISPFASIIERCMMREPHERIKGALQAANEIEKLLTELGLVDLKAELQALSDDPAHYQDGLTTRLPCHYCEWARRTSALGDYELSVELAERALIMEPMHAEAEKILKEAQRALIKRGSRYKLWISLASLPLFVGLVFASNTLTTAPADIPPLIESQIPSKTLTTKNNLRSETTAAALSDSAPGGEVKTPTSSSTEMSTASSDGKQDSISKPLRASISSNTRATKTRNAKSRKPQRRRRRSIKSMISFKEKQNQKKTLKKSKLKPKNNSLVGSIPKKTQVFQRIDISSLYKGVQVSVDGVDVGHIYEIDRAGGLDLSIGETHKIEFSSPFCKKHLEVVRYQKVQSRAPRLVFECSFKPATFIIKSRINADIFLNGPQPRRLGMTNQILTFPLQATEAKLDLLIMSGDGRGEPLTLRVAAGQHKEVSR